MNKNVSRLVITALFAALTYVATSIIRIPTVGTNGYVNIGDVAVLLCAWVIGGAYGAMAAGIGSALADLLAGYAMYVPGTFTIKFVMAISAYLIFKSVSKLNINKMLGYVLSGVVAEIIMVAGYFLYESTLLGYGFAAAASIGSNAIQGVTCVVVGTAAIIILEQAKAVKRVKKYI
jgi:uncharacterized membrane protein